MVSGWVMAWSKMDIYYLSSIVVLCSFLYKNPTSGKKQPIPRHQEIDEHLAKHIIKELT